jgi:hypothetical protein
MKIPDIKLIFVMILGCFFITGCENRYRYPCQNPENWDKEFCQKPICEVSRDCPEYIFKGQENLTQKNMSMSSPSPCKGEMR